MKEAHVICTDCGKKHGEAKFFATTFHKGVCDWCKQEKSVTSSRHFGHPELK